MNGDDSCRCSGWVDRTLESQLIFEFHWIEAWYNRRRLYSKLGYQSPIEWEDHYRHTTNTMAA